jgi:hypothetical protein
MEETNSFEFFCRYLNFCIVSNFLLIISVGSYLAIGFYLGRGVGCILFNLSKKPYFFRSDRTHSMGNSSSSNF